ncbi:MFS transporter [Paludibacterium paludis]|nr:MFS transporter [Paludibacterium paludis]
MPSPSRPVLLRAHPECPPWQVHLFGLTLGLVTGADFVAVGMMGFAGGAIQGGLGATQQEFLWTLSAFASGAIVANLLLGRIATAIGYRRYTQWALRVFMLGSLACALADSITALSVARGLQGLGGGGLFSASRILLQLVSRPDERKRLMRGFLGGCFALSALSPWLSALLAEHVGWQAIFLLQAAYAPCLMLLVHLVYPRHSGTPTRLEAGSLDWAAVLALGVGSLMVLHVLEDVRLLRFAAEPALAGWLVTGLLSIAYAGVRLLGHRHPWLDLGRLAGRRYLTGLALYTAYYLFSGVWSAVLAALLMRGLGFDFATSAMVFTLGGLITVGASQLYLAYSRWLANRRALLVAGWLTLSASAWWLARSAMPGADLAALMPAILLHGLVPVLSVFQIGALTYLDLGAADYAHAYQLKNMLRELAGAVGTGFACLQMQDYEAQARHALIRGLDDGALARAGLTADMPALARIAEEIARQAVLLACDHTLRGLAAMAGAMTLAVAWQRGFA